MAELISSTNPTRVIVPPPKSTIQGVLIFDNGSPAAALTVRLYNVGFAGKDAELGETKSDAKGNYSFSYIPPAGAATNLQLRVLDATGKEVTISNTLYNATAQETLNLVVPVSVQPLAPEYTRLAADMQTQIGGIANLAQAQESATQLDLTLLNQNTRWDARLVALASTAAQQTAATGLRQDVLYALFRIGLPTDVNQLAMVPAATVKAALTRASESGIVSLNVDQIATATNNFQTFATKTAMNLTTPGAVSNFTQLMASVPAAQQTAFAKLFFSQTTPGADLWTEAAQLNIPAATIRSLQLQGKLLHLTFNNATLAQKLQTDIGSLDNLPQLAAKNYYKQETWAAAITALAGTGVGSSSAGTGSDAALGGLIPRFTPAPPTPIA